MGLPKASASLWGAPWHHHTAQPLASALAQGLPEKMSHQCAHWCPVYTNVCGGGVGESQTASFFQDMEKKGGP